MSNTLQHLRLADYIEKPWKNRRGSTRDIVMLPKGANDDNFDLRLSLTPLPSAAPFSTFAGIERVITLIEGTALTLKLDSHSETLHPGDSLAFGPDQQPFGTPETPARVINLMARRRVWQIDLCRVLPRIPAQETDHFTCMVALEAGMCHVNAQAVPVAALDSILLTGANSISATGRCLLVKMHPAGLPTP